MISANCTGSTYVIPPSYRRSATLDLIVFRSVSKSYGDQIFHPIDFFSFPYMPVFSFPSFSLFYRNAFSPFIFFFNMASYYQHFACYKLPQAMVPTLHWGVVSRSAYCSIKCITFQLLYIYNTHCKYCCNESKVK